MPSHVNIPVGRQEAFGSVLRKRPSSHAGRCALGIEVREYALAIEVRVDSEKRREEKGPWVRRRNATESDDVPVLGELEKHPARDEVRARRIVFCVEADRTRAADELPELDDLLATLVPPGSA